MNDPVTRLDYCQSLLVSQINDTLTNFANHSEQFSHDQIKRYLGREKLIPRLVWENVASQVFQTRKGYVVFDDTVLDLTLSLNLRPKRHNRRVALSEPLSSPNPEYGNKNETE